MSVDDGQFLSSPSPIYLSDIISFQEDQDLAENLVIPETERQTTEDLFQKNKV